MVLIFCYFSVKNLSGKDKAFVGILFIVVTRAESHDLKKH